MRWRASSLSSSCTWQQEDHNVFTQEEEEECILGYRIEQFRELSSFPFSLSMLGHSSSTCPQFSTFVDLCLCIKGYLKQQLFSDIILFWNVFLLIMACLWSHILPVCKSPLCSPSTLSVRHRSRAVPLSADCRGPIVNVDTDRASHSCAQARQSGHRTPESWIWWRLGWQ